jgi:hypothetical protein
VFGVTEPEGAVPAYIQKVMAGSFRAGADVAACMFALHYFFETEATLNGFLRNLEETVKMGGLFIGCCFDGDKVFNLLRGVQKGHSKSGMEGDAPIWTITKDYDHDVFAPDETSIGLGIDVEFMSIGTAHKEYLVSFEFLKKKMKSVGFRLLDERECKEMGLQESTNTFDVSHKMAERAGKKYAMPDAVKQFSFLNRWFIFKHDMEQPAPPIELEEVPVEEAAVAAPVAAKPSVARSLKKLAASIKKESSVAPVAPVAPATASVAAVPEQESAPVEEVKEEEKPAIAAPPSESTLPDRTRKFAEVELFKFGSDVRDIDSLGIKDSFAGKYLALIAPFPIPDRDDPSKIYPSLDHYLAGMRIKHASNRPEQAALIFGTTGKLHQDYLSKRRISSVKRESPKDFDLLIEEAADIRKRLTKTALNSSRIVIDDAKWTQVKDRILMEGLQYRFERDERFHTIVEAAKERGKYLLFIVSSTAKNAFASELGGTRSIATSQIVGENKVGRFIMELAGFRF